MDGSESRQISKETVDLKINHSHCIYSWNGKAVTFNYLLTCHRKFTTLDIFSCPEWPIPGIKDKGMKSYIFHLTIFYIT